MHQDQKIRNVVLMGSQGSLEEKTVTVCHGADFVNVNFANFCCTRKDIAQRDSSSSYQPITGPLQGTGVLPQCERVKAVNAGPVRIGGLHTPYEKIMENLSGIGFLTMYF
ncbi:jg21905 [Pararge aegeria aegeria]|uniref:Jg21905 protein n=1 Tax=Pararge aegeria aegeria TaxID=348720 RepID=A0A8S4RPZ2_9NEOP|nr:jg21905 [Pararge aegeria aegeria]